MFNKLFDFENMITPSIITIVYRILVILMIIGGVITIFSSISYGIGGVSLFSLIVMILGLFLGILFTRILFEIILVVFKIHETLKEINQKLKNE